MTGILRARDDRPALIGAEPHRSTGAAASDTARPCERRPRQPRGGFQPEPLFDSMRPCVYSIKNGLTCGRWTSKEPKTTEAKGAMGAIGAE